MPNQLVLRFDELPVSCPVQERYHAIAPCLAGQRSIAEQARLLDVSFDTVSRWLARPCDRLERFEHHALEIVEHEQNSRVGKVTDERLDERAQQADLLHHVAGHQQPELWAHHVDPHLARVVQVAER